MTDQLAAAAGERLSDPINIGKWANFAGDVWTIVGINYLGDYDLERFEVREDGRYKIGSSCRLGLSQDHPHYAFLVDESWMAMEIADLRRRIANDARRHVAEVGAGLPRVEEDGPWAWAVVDPNNRLRNQDGNKIDRLICWDYENAQWFRDDANDKREEGEEQSAHIVPLYPQATFITAHADKEKR